ncbi:zinc finger HIT domain-containing protein 3 [Halyomorpha halys]|uniref:zinc finger HIT domain-containing protein 3 n=1 Tax=Halyomorpha halys TaxID=286706 RepID=UPI0006D4F64E|nr:zinc finger HIT domain-containing protein 3 [Halyomorpha halys]
MNTEGKVCAYCDSISKYKCPKCFTPYCSVKCCQQHKLENCVKAPLLEENNKVIEKKYISYPTEDTLPPEKLQKLRDSISVKECLNNPHLRHIMAMIDKSSNPTDLIAQAMMEPIFVEFATECLKVVQPPDQPEVYSSDED